MCFSTGTRATPNVSQAGGAADDVEGQVLQRFEADATFTHVELLAQPAEARVSILLYDALDFSTDRDDGGGQTRESLSRVASASAAVTGLDPARTETVSRCL